MSDGTDNTRLLRFFDLIGNYAIRMQIIHLEATYGRLWRFFNLCGSDETFRRCISDPEFVTLFWDIHRFFEDDLREKLPAVMALILRKYPEAYDDIVHRCFRRTQLQTKVTMMEILQRCWYSFSKVLVVGSWFGLTEFFLQHYFRGLEVDSLDLDEGVYPIHELVNPYVGYGKFFNLSMMDKEVPYGDYDLIINPSLEHVDGKKWLEILPSGSLVLCTGNNLHDEPDHCFTHNFVTDFIEDTVPYLEPMHIGCSIYPTYKRFFILGTRR